MHHIQYSHDFPSYKPRISGDFPQQFLSSSTQGRLLISNFRMKFQVPKGTLKDKLAWQLDWKLGELGG
jgi:hypothetical protein